jgi:hypothetical protein
MPITSLKKQLPPDIKLFIYMALIKCTECSADVSDKAASCPTCGNPLQITSHRRKEIVTQQQKASPIVVFGGLFLLAAFAFAIFGGLWMLNNSHSPTSPPPALQPASVSPTPSVSASPISAVQQHVIANNSPVEQLSADFLYNQYKNNEVSADATYKDKVVILTGDIKEIGKDISDTPYIVIGGQGFLDGVQCMFPKVTDSPVANASKGQTVTVKGRVAGKMGNVLLRDCEFQYPPTQEAKHIAEEILNLVKEGNMEEAKKIVDNIDDGTLKLLVKKDVEEGLKK